MNIFQKIMSFFRGKKTSKISPTEQARARIAELHTLIHQEVAKGAKENTVHKDAMIRELAELNELVKKNQ